ncbi:MAG TPA: glycosyltransferase [Woeseiaceae bacterium]|nr:glycosyltransferase [Woeseiaceae bacterium]
MTREILMLGFEWLFFGYFLLIYATYAALNMMAVVQIRRYLQIASLTDADNVFSTLDLPISVIVPAYNEAATIITSTRAMLQLEYPDYEVLVINDGSKDETLQKLIEEFGLQPFPEAYRQRVPCKRVRGVYGSPRYPMLRVIDKENGGSKADAMNAGINACRYPIICAVDADSILQPDSLRRAVRPFLEDPDVVAAGGTVRIANGCKVRGGFLEEVGLPRNFLALVQVVEYLRAFLFGRMGWDYLNSVLIVSGAFGMFDKETVVRVGGYRDDAIGEDMELILRMHRLLRQEGRRYRITFVPDPICWTDAPEDAGTLRKQRIRWQHGLGQSLMMHGDLLFQRKGGAVSWVAMPFFYVFELFGPAVELAGYVFMIVAGLAGWIPWETTAVFFCLALGLGVLLSTSALVLEEMSFHVYPRARDLLKLFLVAIVENFGYRQLTVWWRLKGLFGWLRGQVPEWGEMKRSQSMSEG